MVNVYYHGPKNITQIQIKPLIRIQITKHINVPFIVKIWQENPSFLRVTMFSSVNQAL